MKIGAGDHLVIFSGFLFFLFSRGIQIRGGKGREGIGYF